MKKKTDNRIRIGIRLEPELYRDFKHACVDSRVKMQEVIQGAIERFVKRWKARMGE